MRLAAILLLLLAATTGCYGAAYDYRESSSAATGSGRFGPVLHVQRDNRSR